MLHLVSYIFQLIKLLGLKVANLVFISMVFYRYSSRIDFENKNRLATLQNRKYTHWYANNNNMIWRTNIRVKNVSYVTALFQKTPSRVTLQNNFFTIEIRPYVL